MCQVSVQSHDWFQSYDTLCAKVGVATYAVASYRSSLTVASKRSCLGIAPIWNLKNVIGRFLGSLLPNLMSKFKKSKLLIQYGGQ